jgi:hypothetical protein
MAIPRQNNGLRWLFIQTGTYDLLIAVFAAVIGLTSAVNYAAQNKPMAALLVGAGTIGVLVFSAVKQMVAPRIGGRRQRTNSRVASSRCISAGSVRR